MQIFLFLWGARCTFEEIESQDSQCPTMSPIIYKHRFLLLCAASSEHWHEGEACGKLKYDKVKHRRGGGPPSGGRLGIPSALGPWAEKTRSLEVAPSPTHARSVSRSECVLSVSV